MLIAALYFLLFFCVVVQLVYVAYYFFPFIFYNPPELAKANFPVSVIIAAHNEQENLQQLLPAVLNQDYEKFEVIVVDDRSTDGTKKYLSDLRHIYPDLRIQPVEQTAIGYNPKKYALESGIAAARYEHLLFTDADCLPLSKSWISNMAKGFWANTAVVLGYSPYIRFSGFLNTLIRYETLLSAIQYLTFAVKGNTYMGVGRNLAYTKTCFYQNNGFKSHKETLGGDDDLFVRDASAKHKINIVISAESQTISIPKKTYADWFLQKRRHLAVGQQYKMADKMRIGGFMLANIFFYLSAIILLFAQYNLSFFAILVCVRCIVVFTVYGQIARKINEQLTVMLIPLLDLVYILNYVILGLSVLMFKKVRWK